jgi:isopentenyldiphosphate isomerase
MTQSSLFDPDYIVDLTRGRPKATAKQRRDKAITKVELHAAAQFLFAADKAIRKTAKAMPKFIIDDVWKNMPSIRTDDNRAMGAAIRRAVREGVITGTHEYRPSEQVQCHANPRRVWQSCIQ